MNCKTEGIVLRTIKHQDNNLIATVYTREYGRLGFMVRGYRSARGARQHSYFQPLSIVNLVYRQKEGRELQGLRETQHATILRSIQTDPVKMALGLTMLEVVKDTVREEAAPNPPMYDFIRQFIVHTDAESKGLIQAFVYSLLHLSRYLGFFPNDLSDSSPAVHFDVANGSFLAAEYQREPISLLLRRFMYTDIERSREITFDQEAKRHLLGTLFGYYQQHIDGFNYPQTLRVFGEVFG